MMGVVLRSIVMNLMMDVFKEVELQFLSLIFLLRP